MAKERQMILVTGGAGLIGMHLCAELSRRGVGVRLFDVPEQIERVRPYIAPGIEVFYGSILDQTSLRDAMRGSDAVVHLAAYLGVRRTETNRLRCIEININGTQNVLDCAVQDGLRRIVFASSSEVYGEPVENPVRETTMTQGKTVYAISKLAGEEMAKAYSLRYPRLEYTILRFFNTFGPYQVAQFVIPKFIRGAMMGKPPVIYGRGSQIRSYCYAEDSGCAAAEAVMNPRAAGETFNIGNSQNVASLVDLARMVIRLCGQEGKIEPVIRAAFENTDRTEEREVFERICDSSKALSLLGFEPKYSLAEGIQKVIDHGIIHPRWATSDVDYTVDDWV